MKKLLIGLTLCAALTLCLLTSSALAALPTEVTVGNHNVTIGYEAARALYSGTVQYANGVLTLENVDVADTHSFGDNRFGRNKAFVISADGDLVIHLRGANTVSPMATTLSAYGIYVNGALTLTGEAGAALTVNDAAADEDSCGIFASSSGSDAAVLIDTQGTIHVSAGTANFSYGICGENTGSGTGVKISGGTVTAKGSAAMAASRGIYGVGGSIGVDIAGGTIDVAESGDVTDGAQVFCPSAGIYGEAKGSNCKGGVLISGSAVVTDAHSGTIQTDTIGKSSGIFGRSANGGVSVKISDSASVTASSNSIGSTTVVSCGIYGYVSTADTTPVEISGGTVNATGGSGIYSTGVYIKSESLTSNKSAIVLSGGTLTATGGNSAFYVLSEGAISFSDDYATAANRTVSVGDTAPGTTWDESTALNESYKYVKIAPAPYGVWVRGVSVTCANKGDVLGDGKVSYAPATGTLTLNNATITTTGTGDINDPASHGIYAERDILIALAGINTITATSSDTGDGIFALGSNSAYCDITVSGGGSLAVTASTHALYGQDVAFAANCGTVATAGETIVIYSSGDLTIAGGNISVMNTAGYIDTCGLQAAGNITISGGTVTVTVSGNGSCGINSGRGNITISGGTVNAAGGYRALATPKGSITLSGGTMTAVGGTQAVDAQPMFSDAAQTDSNWYQWKENTAATEPSGDYTVSSATSQFTNYATAKYLKVMPAPYVIVGDVTVSGSAQSALTGRDAALTLAGCAFKNRIDANTDVSAWFTNRPAGVLVKLKTAVSANDTAATVTIYGTPTAASTAAMAVTLPADVLAGGVAVTAKENANAKWDIAWEKLQAVWNGGSTGGRGTLLFAVQMANKYPGTTIQLIDNIAAEDFPVSDQDVSQRTPFIFTGTGTILDLNGKTIDRGLTSGTANGNVFTVNAGAGLTLKDTGTGGMVTGGRNTDNGGGFIVHGEFRLESGAISGNRVNSETGNGGGVYVSSGGKFTMAGGTISNNKVTLAQGVYAYINRGGGVYAYGAGSEFIMTAGTISDNWAAYGGGVAINAGSFNMSGTAQISENIASSGQGGSLESRGGGVYIVNYGTFSMTNGWINSNSAKNGCGVYVANGSTFTLSDLAHIDNNKVNPAGGSYGRCTGGGVYVATFTQEEQPCVNDAKTKFIMEGGTISNNEAYMGGGVCSIGNSTLNSGTIFKNTATFSGGGVFSNGSFTMKGGAITENTVTAANANKNGYGGGLTVENNTFDMQGGEISNNAANGTGVACGGGGVCIMKGTFTMSSTASIHGNTAKYGGGVYVIKEREEGVYHHGTFRLTGGSITGNTATTAGGGVYVGSDLVFASGAPTVSGNTNGNVYLPAGALVKANAALTGGSIGVMTEANAALTRIAQGDGYALTSSDSAVFRSDVAAFGVEYVAAAGSEPAHARLVNGKAPKITKQPCNYEVNEGQAVTYSLTATGNPAPTYQWQLSMDKGANWADIMDATSDSYTLVSASRVQHENKFRCIVKNGISPDEVSDEVWLLVNRSLIDPPASDNAITGIQSGQTFTKGETITFTAVGGGMDNNAPITGDKRWRANRWATNPSGDFGAGYTQRFSTTDMTLGAHTLTVTFAEQQYDGAAWADTGETDAKSVPFTLVAALKITAEPTDQTAFVGEKATFSLTAAGDGLTYQWFVNRQDGRGWQKLEGSTASKHVTTQTTLTNDGYRYYCHIEDKYGNTADSKAVTLHVKEVPVTGDHAVPGLWLALLLLCGIGLTITVRRKRT